MTDRPITPLRRTGSSRYSDTSALNDIHALLTSTDPGDGTLTDIALGRPVACVEAGDACVRVRQATDGTGLLVEICTKTAAEHAALTVTLDGAPLHAPHPVGCGPA